MKSEINISSLTSLLLTIKTLKRHDTGPQLTAAEKSERVASLIRRLGAYQDDLVVGAAVPMTRNAEER